jgi:AbrB family looped-hinge helix DNA binding protein
MLTQMNNKNHVTIPKDIVTNLGLKIGDKFEVFEKDGLICFMPVTVYPKSYVDKLEAIVAETKTELESFEPKACDDIDELITI